MNKFLLVLLVSFISCRIEFPFYDFYPVFVSLFKGMAKNEKSPCIDILMEQEDTILEYIFAAIDEVKLGQDVNTAIQIAMSKIIGINGLVTECNIFGINELLIRINSKEGIVKILQTLIKNIDEVYSYEEKIKESIKSKDYNSAAEALGHILSIAYNFKVNL